MEKKTLIEEVKKQLCLAGPLIVANLLSFVLQTISLMYIGRFGKLQLSGAAVALTFANVTGFTVLIGMGSALETLCGQAYGAKQAKLLGIHLQRAMLVLTIISIPLSIPWYFSGQILRVLKQDHHTSAVAGSFVCWLIPSLFAFGFLQCLLRFLQTQNITHPQLISSGITTCVHALLCWVFVYKTSLGCNGAALATSVSYWFNAILLALYVKLSPACKDSWVGFDRKSISDVLIFIKLAIPSALMVCLEFCSFEILVIISGQLPDPLLETSVLSVSLNISSVIFMITMGLGAAISTRVSNELGAGNPQAARLAILVSSGLAITEGLVVGSTIVLLRNFLGKAYSNDKLVVKSVAAMVPLVALSHFISTIQCVLSGVSRGCGWQYICVWISLGSFYAVGFPVSIVMAFVVHLGGKGLWLGIICALSVQDILLVLITARNNLGEEAKKVREKALSSNTTLERQINLEALSCEKIVVEK